MQGKHLFEYAVIRVMPRVEREEFMNVGVILYCKELKFLQATFALDEKRLQVFCEKLDVSEVKDYMQSIERICNGAKDGGPIAQLDMASRFRWLTAQRSTIVQTSKVHPGFCVDARESLVKLQEQLVG